MSFPRAKLNRFNEVAGCAPPPGTYEPKWEEKPILGTMARNPRFTQRRSLDGDLESSRVLSTPVCEQKVRHKSLSVLRRKTVNKNGSVGGQKKPDNITAARSEKHIHCACVTQERISLGHAISLIREMKVNFDGKVDQVNSIMKRLEDSSPYIIMLKEACDNYRLLLKSMKSAQRELEDRSTGLQEFNITYQIKIAELQDTIDYLITVRNQLAMDEEVSRRKVAGMENTIESLKQKSAELVKELAAQALEKESLENTMTMMEEIIKERSMEVNELNVKVDEADDKLHSVKMQKLELEGLLHKAEEAINEVEKRCASEKVDLLNEQKTLAIQFQEKLDVKCGELMSYKDQLNCMRKRLSDAENNVVKEREFYELEVLRMEKIWGDKSKVKEKQLELEIRRGYETKSTLLDAKAELKSLQESKEMADIELNRLKNLLEEEQKRYEELVKEGQEQMTDFKNNITLVLKAAGVELPDDIKEDLDVFVAAVKSAVSSHGESLEMQKLKRDIVEKDTAIQNLKRVIGPFRDQLELYEQERVALRNLTKQTRGEMEKLALQQAAALGHQNHKQKIKHLVKLKEHNLKLGEENNELRAKLRQKDRMLAKFMKQKMPTTPTRLDDTVTLSD